MPSRSRRALALVFMAGLLFGSIGTAEAVALQGSPLPPGAGPTPPSSSTYLEGIDVSHWQGTIDWPKVATTNKRFVIMKATEGTGFVDPMYATNHAAARAVGLRATAYHFASPDATAGEAVQEADHFVSVAALADGDLIPALDLEVTGGLGTTALQSWVGSWLKEVTVRLGGVRPMIYTSPHFWKTYMGDTRSFADSGYKVLWVAHWFVTSPTVPAQNWGGNGWTFWQYTDCGSVAGISGCVDLDRYNGTDLSPVTYHPFSLAASPTSQLVKQGKSATYTIAITRREFDSPITLSVAGLPLGATAAISPNPVADSSPTLAISTSNVPTITPVGTYKLTISGNGGGANNATSASLVVTDGIAPAVAVPSQYLRSGVRIGSTTTPVRIRWSASDPSGIASYHVQRQVNGGSWSGVSLPTATTTAILPSLTFGSTYRSRVSATDRQGNTSAWAYGAGFTPRRAQQSSSSVTYGGTWHTVYTSSASGGSLRYATAAGARATYSFWGASIGWVAYRGPNRGSAKIYLDGVYKATVSLYASTYTSKPLVYAAHWGSAGTHTIKVVVVGTAGHPRVDVDAFVRLTLV